MSDELSPAVFGKLIREFLERSVEAEGAKETHFGAGIGAHLGEDPNSTPIVSEEVSIIELPNVQAAFEAWSEAPGRSTELLGVSSEAKRYGGIGLSELLAPSGGMMSGHAPRPGPV